jgi:quinol monooxygenase YgiN
MHCVQSIGAKVMSDTVSFIVHLPGKPGRVDELEQGVLGVVEAMSHEPDFVNTYLCRALDDSNTLVLFETWACSREYFFEHHLKAPYRMAYEDVLPTLLRNERTIEFLDPIRAYLRR